MSVWDRGGYVGNGLADELEAIAEASNWHRMIFREESSNVVIMRSDGAPNGESQAHYIESFVPQIGIDSTVHREWLEKHGMTHLLAFTSATIDTSNDMYRLTFQ